MLKGKVGSSEEYQSADFKMTLTRYLIIDKKDDVYLKIEADEDIRRELGQFFTFEVPGFKFMLNLEIVYGTERLDYSHIKLVKFMSDCTHIY